jgi:hypothetical protein
MVRRAYWLLVFALVGCSAVNDPGRHQGGSVEGDAGEPDAGGGPIPADEFCGEFARLACTGRAECCPEGLPGSRQECIEGVRSGCQQDLHPVFSDPRTGYSAEKASEVLQDGRALIDACDPDIARWYVYDLITVMRGTAAQGQNCTPDPSPQEDPAAFFSCERDDGQVCRPDNLTTWKCQGISAEDGQCAVLYHCQRGLYCTGLSGSCQPQKQLGEPCSKNEECASLLCTDAGECAEYDENAYCIDVEQFYPDSGS